MQLPQGKPLTPAHLQMLRQQQQQLHQQQQQQQQAASPQIKAVGKSQVQQQQLETKCNGMGRFDKCDSLLTSVR